MRKSRRWWKPTKYCEVERSSGCLVVRWQKSDAKTRRNWGELPSDILLLIFEKLGAIDILTTASLDLVCQNWNRLTRNEPMLWQRIDMTNHDLSLSMYNLKQMAKIAIDRSAGKLEEFYADCFATDDLLLYIATRTKSLKSIGLFLCPGVSIEGLMAMAQRSKTLRTLRLINCLHEDCPDYLADIIKMFPMLEELEITCTFDSTKLCKTIGPVCTQLKCFRWNDLWYSRYSNSSWESFMHDTEALHIGENMKELRSLQLIGNQMTNKGLEAILEGCPYLVFLDIRNCFNLVLNESIMTKLSRIRYLKLPGNSADEYLDSISSDKYYYYIEGPRHFCFCPYCFDPVDLLDPHNDYDDYYYDTFSTLDDMYGDVMFLY